MQLINASAFFQGQNKQGFEASVVFRRSRAKAAVLYAARRGVCAWQAAEPRATAAHAHTHGTTAGALASWDKHIRLGNTGYRDWDGFMGT